MKRIYAIFQALLGWGTMLQALRSPVLFPMRLLAFGHGVAQPLPEMSTSNFPGGKGRPAGRPARQADNLTAICEPIV
jgi:hypothetical protein